MFGLRRLYLSLLFMPSGLLIACDDDPGRLSNLVENRAPLPDVVG